MKALVVLIALARVAHADSDDDPWAQGVPHAQQLQANVLFAEANQLFAQQAHGPALEKYKAAIALWDHPLIRFNMAVTEIRLDHILDAAEDLERALRYGEAPFTRELYGQALDYQALVKRQVGELEASCSQPDAHVQLDGKPWFQCPGTHKQRVLAGEHALIGERPGYMTRSVQLVVAGGTTTTARVELLPIATAVKLVYPYNRMLPLAIGGGGAAVALGGLGVWFLGSRQMDRFNTDFGKTCPTGCLSSLSDHPSLASEHDSAVLKGNIGIAMMTVGGIAAVGGVVLAVLDRPKRVTPNIEVAPTAGGAMTYLRFGF
jgi:hypothetical protein